MILDKETLRTELATLDGWSSHERSIVREIPMHNWKGVMMLANAIAHLAEQAWHHPDLTLTFSSISINLSTHDEGGVTDKDIILARKINDLVSWNPKDENAQLGTPSVPEYRYLKKD